jgi:naringenin degradation protein FdeH
MPFEIRRIVSGHNAQGKSIFIIDDKVGLPEGRRSSAGTSVVELWQTDSTPADNSGDKDPTKHAFRLPPPANGSVFRVVEYPPDKERFAAMSSQDWSSDAQRQGYHRDAGNARHAGFHKTDTIDYAIVIEGEVYALMDEGEKLMKTGDVLVQRGTSHAWANRSDKPARVAFILIDAKPVP